MRVSTVERDVTSNIDSGIQATINVSPKAFKVLFDLYANKLESICRELMANCYDAHVSVGLNQPFVAEVVENSILDKQDPFLRFRDHGPGISKEDIQRVYMRFFESTKNDSNSQVGAFGLGAKSPWCYTEVYTVKSYQRGMACTYALYLDASGYPNCALVSEDLSEEPTGLEVVVPLKEGDVHQARSVLKSLTIGYLLNGTENRPLNQTVAMPEKFIDFEGLQIYKMPGKVSILYGVTLYSLDNSVLQRLLDRGSQNLRDAYEDFKQIDEAVTFNISALVHAPLGMLDLVPSRESLSYDEKSLVAILSIIEAQAENYIRAYNEKFSSRSSFKLARLWRGDRNIKHFFMRHAVKELTDSGLSSSQCSILTSNNNGQFKVQRGGSEKSFISFFTSRVTDLIVVGPTNYNDGLADFKLTGNHSDMSIAKKADSLVYSRLRRIGIHKNARFSLVSQAAADWLIENGIKVVSERSLLDMEAEAKAKKRQATQLTRQARVKGGQFSVLYGSELNYKKGKQIEVCCKRGDLPDEASGRQADRLNRLIDSGKRVLLFPVDWTGPLPPSYVLNLMRTRSGEPFTLKFRYFLNHLKGLGVIHNSDALMFYASKKPPISGVDGWSVLKGRIPSQLSKIEGRARQECRSEVASRNNAISNMFKLTGRVPPLEGKRVKRVCALVLEDTLKRLRDYSPLSVDGSPWFKFDMPSMCSIKADAVNEMKEEFVKNYPILGILKLDSMTLKKTELVKDYIKMVDANRKGEVYAIS